MSGCIMSRLPLSNKQLWCCSNKTSLGLSVEIDLHESFAKHLVAQSSGDLITATDPTIQSTVEVI